MRVKLLGTWLQGDRSPTFCRLLARNTARAKPGYLASGATWSFLNTALAKCVLADIAAKRRGATRSAAAGMLRATVRCAQDARLSDGLIAGFSSGKRIKASPSQQDCVPGASTYANGQANAEASSCQQHDTSQTEECSGPNLPEESEGTVTKKASTLPGSMYVYLECSAKTKVNVEYCFEEV